MRTDELEESSNVEDRRGAGGGGFGGGRGGIRLGGGGIGIGTILIALIAWFVFGINPLTILGMAGGTDANVGYSQPAPQSSPANNAAQEQMASFVKKTLNSTERVWSNIFTGANAKYQAPVLVLYSGRTATACGTGQAAAGPFYCPADGKVYIDLRFYDMMKQQMGAGGDFAQAYVIAHEIGHHIQNLQGISDKVDRMRSRMSERAFNALSVRVELQADCYAGIWAKRADEQNRILQAGDVEEAMNAAAKIGDDALQKREQGYAVPDSFTHGTSAQRMTWFNKGLQTGSVKACDTFNNPV